VQLQRMMLGVRLEPAGKGMRSAVRSSRLLLKQGCKVVSAVCCQWCVQIGSG